MHDEYEDDWFDDESVKSKTRVKKEMLALQELGEQLIELRPEQLDRFPLSDTLRKAIDDAPRITKRGAARRHRQYIGKLMRDADGDVIAGLLNELKEEQHRLAQRHHQIENWRDRLIDGDETDVANFIESFPACDRQQLRQLVRNAKTEKGSDKPPVNARKLFKLVREIFAAHD